MLAGTVDTLEGLLVEEGLVNVTRKRDQSTAVFLQSARRPLPSHLQFVAVSNLVGNVHRKQVVVHSNRRLLKDGRHLKLSGRDLVVAGLDRDAELVALEFGFGDGGQNTAGNAAKVVVLELLVARRQATNQGAAADLEVGPHLVDAAVNEEELLLGSEGGVAALDVGLADEVEKTGGGGRDGLVGAEEDGLFVEGIAVVRDEDRGHVESGGSVRAVLDVHGAVKQGSVVMLVYLGICATKEFRRVSGGVEGPSHRRHRARPRRN